MIKAILINKIFVINKIFLIKKFWSTIFYNFDQQNIFNQKKCDQLNIFNKKKIDQKRFLIKKDFIKIIWSTNICDQIKFDQKLAGIWFNLLHNFSRTGRGHLKFFLKNLVWSFWSIWKNWIWSIFYQKYFLYQHFFSSQMLCLYKKMWLQIICWLKMWSKMLCW